MSPRYSIFQSPTPHVPSYSDRVNAANLISNPAIREARLKAINGRFATSKPVRSATQRAESVDTPMSSDDYRNQYRRIYSETAGNGVVNRWPRLNALAHEYRMSHLSADSRAALQKAQALEQNPNARARLIDLRKTKEHLLAVDEARRIALPSPY